MAQVKDFYRGHWTDYPLNLQGVLKHLEELYPEGVEGKRVIDGGSGSGMVSVAFAILGADVTGVDVSPECIANGKRSAARHNVKCRFLEGDLVTLDLGEDEKFDIVYTWGVLHHTPNAEASFHSLAKYLKPGGDIVVAVYLKTFLSGFWNFSRVFYQNSPRFLQATLRTVVSGFLNGYDRVCKATTGKQRYMMRGTDNQEILNDWFGVPHRTFHTYNEVHGWFEKAGLEHHLIHPATGRFKSTSNFVIRNRPGRIGD